MAPIAFRPSSGCAHREWERQDQVAHAAGALVQLAFARASLVRQASRTPSDWGPGWSKPMLAISAGPGGGVGLLDVLSVRWS